ncbi:MAG: GreA/GreB family elongation factor [Cytophagales bacterium]|nr:GreA/GreB family elongation factor [Cytophagales bacterium]
MNTTGKKRIIQKLLEIVEEKIKNTCSALDHVRDARNVETKNSAGDKYETGREMAQIEMDKYEYQLGVLWKQRKTIFEVLNFKNSASATVGSLVTTNHGRYMISVGLGIIEIDGQKIMAISLDSPIGKALKGKKAGEKLAFHGKEIEILDME